SSSAGVSQCSTVTPPASAAFCSLSCQRPARAASHPLAVRHPVCLLFVPCIRPTLLLREEPYFFRAKWSYPMEQLPANQPRSRLCATDEKELRPTLTRAAISASSLAPRTRTPRPQVSTMSTALSATTCL